MARENRRSKYPGITKRSDKFEAGITYANERLYLGRYDRAKEAAYAYCFAQVVLNPQLDESAAMEDFGLGEKERKSVESNVMRLLHPRRLPRKRHPDNA